MHRPLLRFGLIAVAALLSGCSSFEREPPKAAVIDDDAYCCGQGFTQGSKEYVACLKDRDVAATRGSRMERAHRNLAEDMLNGR